MSDININDNEEKVEEVSQVENKPYYERIEDARKELYQHYNRSRRISNILMFVAVDRKSVV